MYTTLLVILLYPPSPPPPLFFLSFSVFLFFSVISPFLSSFPSSYFFDLVLGGLVRTDFGLKLLLKHVVLALMDLNCFPDGRDSKRWFAGWVESEIMVVALR